MIPIFTFLLVLVVSILITRIATIALVQTGLSAQSARFQARSAFTGVGFTTDESEKVVRHPVRRRILLLLMLFGNAGIVTAISSLILSFVGNGNGASFFVKAALLAGGVGLLWLIASSNYLDRQLSRLTSWALLKYTDVNVADYASLLSLHGDYRIVEMLVEEDDWIHGRSLAECRLRDEGLVVLGVHRSNTAFRGAPRGDFVIETGDRLVLYGRGISVKKLDQRRKGHGGDKEHASAIAEQSVVEHSEAEEDRKITEVSSEAGV